MSETPSRLFFVLVFATCACQIHAVQPVTPTAGMVITASMTLKPGTYALDAGITIAADNVTVTMPDVRLYGTSGTGAGITIHGRRHVRVLGGGGFTPGRVHAFFYGIVATDCPDLSVVGVDISFNHQDADQQRWLDINAPADLTDAHNLGGGMLLVDCARAIIRQNVAGLQQNGFDLYGCVLALLEDNSATDNVGWGLHLNGCEHALVRNNDFSNCTRPNQGDAAAILLVNGSNFNTIEGNICRHSADGFLIGNEHGCPSSFNTISSNDCSYAAANAFEATFSNGNIFQDNTAAYSMYGFWLGFSYNTTVAGNAIVGNSVGIEAVHAQNLTVVANRISNTNGPGIVLSSDGTEPFPPADYPCLHLPAQRTSTHHTLRDNTFTLTAAEHIRLLNTTNTRVFNNFFASVPRSARGASRTAAAEADALSAAGGTRFTVAGAPILLARGQPRNIVAAGYLGGNFWCDYTGEGDEHGIGRTPWNASGALVGLAADVAPLTVPNSVACG